MNARMSTQEPGLDLHEWETRWAEIEAALADDPADALVEACDSGQITPGRVRLSQRAKDLAAGKSLRPVFVNRAAQASEQAPAA